MKKPLYFAVPIRSYDEKNNIIRVFRGVYPIAFDRRWSIKRVTERCEAYVKMGAEDLQYKIWDKGYVLFKSFSDSRAGGWIDKPYVLAYINSKGYMENDSQHPNKVTFQ